MADINQKLMQAQIDNLNAQTKLILEQAEELKIKNAKASKSN